MKFSLLVAIPPVLFSFYKQIKTAPYVPSSRKKVNIMINLSKLKSNDVVYDLGCGDGRLLYTASSFVKKCIGYDISVPLIIYCKIN